MTFQNTEEELDCTEQNISAENGKLTGSPEWRFCAVGNIVDSCNDKEGNTYYGTKHFAGGTKVFIYDYYWKPGDEYITVIDSKFQ